MYQTAEVVDSEIQEIAQWLLDRAVQKGLQAWVFPESARRERNWVYMPVDIEVETSKGAWGRAEALQDLQEDWEEAHQGSGTELSIRPGSRVKVEAA